MKTIIRLCLFSVLAGFSAVSTADPIQDLSMNLYKAGWYPNFFRGSGPLTCARTCEIWVAAPSEMEKSNIVDPDSEQAAVCKITRDVNIIVEAINDPSSHWIYGNQFDDEPICHVAHRAGWVERSEYFMCLCAQPTNG
ncbi:hypothetical protein [Microbulbifer sp. TYP-18]|uniref:hypothetical protein n=1 Tax=Microbulbifer sp. TYP-18 TaxID=3230024 RepID=UPI0034C681F9